MANERTKASEEQMAYAGVLNIGMWLGLALLVITFFFMALGTFFGIFEEVIPLVPLMIGLAYYLGWDSLTGLGMSVLATNVGFSTAVFNPFTIGIAMILCTLGAFEQHKAERVQRRRNGHGKKEAPDA